MKKPENYNGTCVDYEASATEESQASTSIARVVSPAKCQSHWRLAYREHTPKITELITWYLVMCAIKVQCVGWLSTVHGLVRVQRVSWLIIKYSAWAG